MVEIGVLVFTDIVKGRILRKKNFFDSMEHYGFRKVLSELKYKYTFCSTQTIKNFDYVLISLTSFYDVLNLMANVPKNRGKTKIIVGGAGVNNIEPILDYIDVANFGRCDLGKINQIIEGEKLSSVWYKSKDQYFKEIYEVDLSNKEGLGDKEHGLGCRKKCSFCFHSWWNNFLTSKNSYDSLNFYGGGSEDFITQADFSKHLIVTGLDGMTEQTRFKVNKKIKRNDIKKALLSLNDFDKNEKKTVMKLYSVIGFPWETETEISKCDLIPTCEEIDAQMKNKLIIKFQLSHFIPRQKTPLWAAKFNWNNYRKQADLKRNLFIGDNIQLYSGLYNSSPIAAAEETVWQRCAYEDEKYLKIFIHKKYRRLNNLQKKILLQKQFHKFFVEQKEERIKNIKTKWNYHKAT